MEVLNHVHCNRTPAFPLFAVLGTLAETVRQRGRQRDVHNGAGSLRSKENLQMVFHIHPSLTSWYLPSSPFDRFSQKVPSLNISLPCSICLGHRSKGCLLATCSLVEIIYYQRVNDRSLYYLCSGQDGKIKNLRLILDPVFTN